MKKNLLFSTVAHVVPTISDPARTELITPHWLRRGLEDPNAYFWLKAVHYMSVVVSGRHKTLANIFNGALIGSVRQCTVRTDLDEHGIRDGTRQRKQALSRPIEGVTH